MNQYVTGGMIRKLRERKNLTQSQLAERIGVSDKTVSKWETGKGYPDISLLEPIAKEFSISVAELIAGNMVTNVNVGANMLRSHFFICPVCGNVIHSMGEAVIYCHGVRLMPEEAEETENEKTLTSEPVKKDPRKGFMKLLKEGSVPLIMGEKKVSDLPINIVYGKKDTTKQSAWNFMNRKDVEKELDEFEKTASTDSFASELPVVLYATKYFHFLTDTTKKDGIKYEIEYLIAGKDSEKENLGMVFWRMIALRFVMNAACVYQDPAKEKEAALLAASILGVTGFPPAVAVAKNLLLLALAYGESVIDVRNLADGKKIPAVKTSSDWQLSFAGLATLNCKRKPVKQGMSYEDYLLLLLISQKDKRQKYFRMMDLMEQNIRRKVSDFKLDQCISSYKITQNLKLKKLGFGGMILPFATYTDLKMSRYATY